MKPFTVLVLAGAALAVPIGARIVELRDQEPFEVGLPERSPLDVRLEGVSTTLPCGQGTLELTADHVFGGHESLLHFKVGPTTFGDLRNAVAVYRGPDGSHWSVRSREARWVGDELRFQVHPIVDDGLGRTTVRREVTVRLDTGALDVK